MNRSEWDGCNILHWCQQGHRTPALPPSWAVPATCSLPQECMYLPSSNPVSRSVATAGITTDACKKLHWRQQFSPGQQA